MPTLPSLCITGKLDWDCGDELTFYAVGTNGVTESWSSRFVCLAKLFKHGVHRLLRPLGRKWNSLKITSNSPRNSSRLKNRRCELTLNESATIHYAKTRVILCRQTRSIWLTYLSPVPSVLSSFVPSPRLLSSFYPWTWTWTLFSAGSWSSAAGASSCRRRSVVVVVSVTIMGVNWSLLYLLLTATATCEYRGQHTWVTLCWLVVHNELSFV